jgi:Ca2+-transporting ATPase
MTEDLDRAWHTLDPDEVVALLDVDPAVGLASAEAAARLDRFGPNSLPAEPSPTWWQAGAHQLADPMNVMLVAVSVVSIVIGELGTGVGVAALVLLNVALGANQELKARASVDALAGLQVPESRVLRDGSLLVLPATDLVPGDVVSVEGGDLVPADGRIIRAASLEVQESALTGESAPVPKGIATLERADTALGDRSNLAFQNTSVTRGTAAIVVVGTGTSTEMGKIAGLLSSVDRSKSPLQRELDGLTKTLGWVAWGALALIMAIGWYRGLDSSELLLLGVAMAISAIPTGMPTFVQLMLSNGAQRLAASNAIVRNLSDVETLGATSAINSDKTGTLTLNQMTTRSVYVGGHWYEVTGGGYSKEGTILSVAGEPAPDMSRLGLGLVLASDATVSDAGGVVGDPTEAALVVLAAKAGISAEETRRAHPRVAEVPFDSAYKFMATFHELPDGAGALVGLVKGAPDVLLGRCSEALVDGRRVPIERAEDEIVAANRHLSEQGLRVLAFAAKEVSTWDRDATIDDPMGAVGGLTFVALTGIIDPLRPTAKASVETALAAGIDVRMITGDHAVTASAIGRELGLGPGVVTGPEFQKLSDAELVAAVPNLHVFGRVAPEDKLRLVQAMQADGMVVAMTGDAVNDAAALKGADIGVAMGSGSEVSKQAAKMVLVDDNFSTLVTAIELGRDVYERITTYIRFQMSQLFALVTITLTATLFAINDGIALTPGMLLFLNFLTFPVLAIMSDVPAPDLMQRPPRDTGIAIFNRRTGPRWIAYGLLIAAAALVPLVWGPDQASTTATSASQTMAYAVLGLATALSPLVMRRDLEPAWRGPFSPFLWYIVAPMGLVLLGTELRLLQQWLGTQPLDLAQWLVSLGLAAAAMVLIEVNKAVRRRFGAADA